MPLTRRIPKRGFTNPFRVESQVVTLDDLTAMPEGAEVSVQVLGSVLTAAARGPSRREILRMPLPERRRILAEQCGRVAEHYDGEDRSEWQGGDIVE